MATCAQDVPDLLEEAINRANFGRKGPVWLDIPLDIQSARIKPENINPKFKPLKSPPISQKAITPIRKVVSSLKKSKRPVILIGSGIRSTKTQSKLKKFVELNKIPLVSPSVDVYPMVRNCQLEVLDRWVAQDRAHLPSKC